MRRFAMNKNAAILGVVGIHLALVEGLGNGTPQPAIQRELPRAQASRAHEAVMENGHHGKIVLVP